MKRGRRKPSRRPDGTRINEYIRVPEVRLFDENDQMIGIVPIAEALRQARESEVDLIEVVPGAVPPIAKLMDYGKFQYEKKKKERDARAKQKSTETKSLQVKIGTGEHDLNLKAKRASEWLKEGHRIKLDLYLRGRSKYLDQNFLQSRLDRLLHLLTTDYKIATPPKKSPKGLSVILEHSSRPKTPEGEKKEISAEKAEKTKPEINQNHENQ
ncbi:MAG TPA: translation initiation factor IF-3 [Candidatus Paceibacterota bacterium]|nr:translation initiation factor IF-3 [Candidatus Paceibacterota bacterium]